MSFRPRAAPTAIALAHPLALALLLAGRVWPALALLFTSHMLYLAGTLNPHSRLFGPVLRRLPWRRRRVWLTIDDGPSEDTAALLAVLARHRAQATFFLVAERAAARPELVRAIVGGGHTIGNHTTSHPEAGFWIAPPWAVRRELVVAQRTLTALAGCPPRWFRGVAGAANPFVEPVLQRLGLQRVSWSSRGFDTIDGDDDRVLARLQRGLAPGAVLLLHEGVGDGGAARRLEALLTVLRRDRYATALPEAPPRPRPLRLPRRATRLLR